MAKSTSPRKQKQSPKKGRKGLTATILALAVAAGAIAMVVNLGGLTKMAVEKLASESLGAKVSIATLDVSLQDKRIDVEGLSIGNPEGYKGEKAITVDKISITASNITKTLLVFDEIAVSGTDLNLEVEKKGTNLTALRENAEKHKSGHAQTAGDAPKVIIKDLKIESASLNPRSTLAGETPQPIKLPDIRITGIGEKNNGATIPEAIAQVMDICVQVAMKASVQSGFLRGMDPGSLKSIQASVGLPENLTDQIKDIGNKVRGLFSD